MDRSSQSSNERRRMLVALALWCGLGILVLAGWLVIRQRASEIGLAEQVAPLTQQAWLPVLVAGESQQAVETELEALTARLARAPGVLHVFGRRGPERLFFALRWPLYLPEADLTRVLRALGEIPPEPPRGFAFALIKPALLGQMEQLNTLYAASSAAAATPDGRAAAALIIAQPRQVAELRQRIRAEAARVTGGPRIELDSRLAQALLFGAPDPLVVDAESPERAREIAAQVRAERARDARFALREARSIHDYLPGDARAQLRLLHAIRAFLTSPAVAAFNQSQRDALRPLLPAPLRALPSVADLPDFVRAPFRSADGHFDHLVHLLPATGLSPEDPRHVREVEAALRALGLAGQARGAFTVAAQAARQLVWVERLALLWFALALPFVQAPLRGWLRLARVRRALSLTLVLAALYLLGCAGASRWLQGALARHAPTLRLDAVHAFPPFVVQLEQPRFARRTIMVEAERASLRLSFPWHLTLTCEGTRLRTDSLAGGELSADLFLGRVLARSSLFSPGVLQELSAEEGELTAHLRRADAARGALDLTGSVAPQPELFARLPLLAEAGDVLGDWIRSTAPRPVQLRGTLSAPELIGLGR